ncbi:hypothetical protein ACFWX8_44755, partial [Streptomyces violascens]
MSRLRDGWGRYRDRRMGTKYPDSGVTSLSAQEVRAALLALNGTGLSRRWSRGPYVGRQWTYEKGPDGHRHKVVRFDSRHMRDPLRNTVLEAGWTWRGVL